MSIPMITPQGSGSTPSSTSSTSSSSNSGAPPSLVSNLPALDGQSTYSQDIGNGVHLSLLQFSTAVGNGTNIQNETSWQTQQYNSNSRDTFYKALGDTAFGLAELYTTILEASQEYAQAYKSNQSNISNTNNQITKYNNNVPKDQDELNKLNSAIQDYNNGNISSGQLQTVINNYNQYVDSRNNSTNQTSSDISQFNTENDTNNAQVADANKSLASTGTAPFATQTAYNSQPGLLPNYSQTVGSPPLNTISYTPSTIPTITNTMNPPVTDDGTSLAEKIYAPIYNLFTAQFQLEYDLLSMQSTFQGYLQFTLFGGRPFLSPSYYTQLPSFMDSNGGSIGSIATSLSNPLMDAILDQTGYLGKLQNSVETGLEYGEHYQEYGPPLAEKATFIVAAFLKQVLSNVGLLAGASTLSFLTNNNSFTLGSNTNLAVSIGLFNELHTLVNQGFVQPALEGILSNSFPGLDAGNLSDLSSKLATSGELFLLQAGLFQLSQALGNPQLTAQVLSTVPSANALGVLDPYVTNSNNLNTQAVNAAVSTNLAQQANVSAQVAQQAVNESINSSLVEGQLNQESYVNGLVQNGIDNQSAITNANYAQSYLQSEIIAQGVLDSTLASQRLSQTLLSSQLIKNIVVNQPEITGRQLRDQLASEFVANGATQSQALLAASTAVAGSSSGFASLSAEALGNSLYASSVNQLAGISSTQSAQALANQLVTNVVGPDVPGSPTSYRQLLDDRISSLTQLNDANVSDQVKSSLAAFLEPTVELYAFADRLRDPANTYLLSSQTGIMYSHPQPNNFSKGVDILV